MAVLAIWISADVELRQARGKRFDCQETGANELVSPFNMLSLAIPVNMPPSLDRSLRLLQVRHER